MTKRTITALINNTRKLHNLSDATIDYIYMQDERNFIVLVTRSNGWGEFISFNKFKGRYIWSYRRSTLDSTDEDAKALDKLNTLKIYDRKEQQNG